MRCAKFGAVLLALTLALCLVSLYALGGIVARADALLSGKADSVPERQMLALVRCRLEHPDYLHDEHYGALLTDCFARLRSERGAGYARFHLPWMLAWYKANRQYRQACLLLEGFPEKGR